MEVVILNPSVDDRGAGHVVSRTGLSAPRTQLGPNDDFWIVAGVRADCILVDEAQFMSEYNVSSLEKGAHVNIPVLCYGLRTDFQGNAFPTMSRLMAISDKNEEIKAVCRCGKKATRTIRLNPEGTS